MAIIHSDPRVHQLSALFSNHEVVLKLVSRVNKAPFCETDSGALLLGDIAEVDQVGLGYRCEERSEKRGGTHGELGLMSPLGLEVDLFGEGESIGGKSAERLTFNTYYTSRWVVLALPRPI